MTHPDVSIVIVTYNSADWIGTCLDSLPAALEGRRAEVVVVDNASQDGTCDLVASRYPEVRLLPQTANLGFAAGVNRGAAVTTAPWVLLLNPDMEARPGALRRLLEFAERTPGHGLYGGRTLTVDGRLERSSCWGLPSVWSMVCFALGLSTLFRHSAVFDPESLGRWGRDSVREVGMITGCLLLVQRSAWERLGGLDERYFVYGEDADFNARARSLGLRPVITPDVEVVHAVGKSSSGPSGKGPLLLAGRMTYARTHFPAGRAAVVVALLRAGVASRALASRVARRGTMWPEAWRRRQEWWNGFPAPGRVG